MSQTASRTPLWANLDDEGIFATTELGLEGPFGDREIRRSSPTRQIDTSRTVRGDVQSDFVVASAEVRGVDQSRAVGTQLQHKAIPSTPAVFRLKGFLRREVARLGLARQVSISRPVYGKSVGGIQSAASHICRVN